jgi:hypothetical protein
VRGGVQLGRLSTAATDWPIVACPGWLWRWRIWWNENCQGKPKYSEKTRLSATLSTRNPTWPDPGSNPGRRGGKPANNRLSYGAASLVARYPLRHILQGQDIFLRRVIFTVRIFSAMKNKTLTFLKTEDRFTDLWTSTIAKLIFKNLLIQITENLT